MVLLAHGWNGRASQMAHFVDPLVDAGYRVVAFDAPAHGRNPGRRTDIFEIVEVIQYLGSELGPFDAAVTQSMGALSVALAARRGVGVKRAFCINPATTLDTLMGQFRVMTKLPERVEEGLRARLDDFLGSGFWEAGYLEVPALVLADESDTIIPYWHGKRFAAACSQARLVRTQGLGHTRIMRDPEVVDMAVRFITGERDAPRGGGRWRAEAPSD